MANDQETDDKCFLDRCLTDRTTGEVYLAQRDRDKLMKAFGKAGIDVRQAFASKGMLLDAFLNSLNDKNYIWFYERCRLLFPHLEDPLHDLTRWTELPLLEYLKIRIYAKLRYLGLKAEDFDPWVREHCGAQFMSVKDELAFTNARRVMELDKLLADRIAAIQKDDTGTQKYLSGPRQK